MDRLASAESWAGLQGAAGFFVDLLRTVLSCIARRGVRPHPPRILAAGAGLDAPTCGQVITPPSVASESSLGCWCSQPIPREERRGEKSDDCAICVYLGSNTRSLGRAVSRRHAPGV